MFMHNSVVRDGWGHVVVGRRQMSPGDSRIAGRNDLDNTVTGRGHCDGCHVLVFARRSAAMGSRPLRRRR